MTVTKSSKSRVHPVKDPLGIEYGSFELMCQAWGADANLVSSRLSRNWDLKRALTEPARSCYSKKAYKPCKDHLGNKFKCQKDMCKYWGILYNTFVVRVTRYKMLIKDALTTPVGHRRKPMYDKNAKFVGYGIKDLADRLGVSTQWLSKNFTDETAIENLKKYVGKACMDHKGNKFESEKDMCDFWHVNYETFILRVHRDNWSLEDALTRTATDRSKPINIGGKTYKSIKEACKDNEILYSTYNDRINRGYSIKDALTKTSNHKKISMDHYGNIYDLEILMCKAYGVDYQTYRKRILRGYSVKDALETPVRQKKGQDHGQ